MSLRRRDGRDPDPGALGLARSFRRDTAGAWRRLCHLCRELAAPVPRDRGGADRLTRFKDETTGTVRSFCATCGTPILYERARSAHMVNVPRALFAGRTGREPRYHAAIGELQDWTYRGEKLVPLKGFPGIVWERPTRNKIKASR